MRTRTNFRDRLADERGQSWVETVVMLPVLVLLLVGLFWLKDLVDMRIRAIEAARYVTWEHAWHAREDRTPDRPVKSNDDLRKELREIGLGRGLQKVEVKQTSLTQYLDEIEEGRDGFEPTFFFPAPFASLLGLGPQNAVQTNLLDTFGDFASTILDIGATLGVPFHDIMAYQTNWKPEADRGVQISKVTYKFGYTGFLRSISNITIEERAALLSHPFNIKRGTDAQEYDMLIGADVEDCLAFSSDGQDAHILPLWILPTGSFPAYTPGIGALSGVGDVLGIIGNAGKAALCGGPGLIQELDDALGGIIDIGWKMPDGTLKEYPELSEEGSGTTSTGSSSTGSGLGGCESTGPTGTTIPGC